MWGWCPAPALRISATRSPASTRMATRSRRLRRGEIPIFEPGLDRAGRRQCQGRPAGFHHRSRRPGRRSRRRVHRGRHAVAARRRPCRSVLMSTPRRARSPRRSTASPSSSPNRRCRSAPATKSSASFARPVPTPMSRSSRIPEFLREGAAIRDFKYPGPHRGRHRRTSARARSWATSIGRCRSIRRR